MSLNFSSLAALAGLLVVGAGVLTAWVIFGTGRELQDLDQLPSFENASVGERAVLQGHIESDASSVAAGFVAYQKEERDRSIAPSGKPSVALSRWRVKDRNTPDFRVVSGATSVRVTGYAFPPFVKNWQHDVRNEDGSAWSASSTRLRGLLGGEPVVAVGTVKAVEAGSREAVFEAQFVAGGTLETYRAAVAANRAGWSMWGTFALFAALIAGIGLVLKLVFGR